jgi:hypothetical protein
LPEPIARAVRERAPRTTPDAPLPPLELVVPRDRAPTREDFLRVLTHYAGNIAQVAAFFGKGRQQVYRWLARYEVELDSFREDKPNRG